jgi:hypothetical protein
MQRSTGSLTTHGLVGLVRLLGIAALAAGCSANGGDESILVLKNVAPPTTTTGGACIFTPAETEAVIVHGTLDTSFGTGYEFTAQLKSRITADTGQEDQRTILLRGANIDLTFVDPNAVTADELKILKNTGFLHFMSAFSAPLAPNGGLFDASFELIPPEITGLLDSKPGFTSTVIAATFTVTGDLAGSTVSSQPFQYAVTLGKQILTNDKGPCASLPTTFMGRVGNTCFFGQDFVVDCCEGSSPMMLVCPAVGTKM